jgi:hypothetical protein
VLAIAHHYDEPVASEQDTYRARVYGKRLDDGMWGGWIVFFPSTGGHVISTGRETTQNSFGAVKHWASGLTHLYLHGALERALALQPEAQLSRDLERIAGIEQSSEAEAETLEAAASLARAESRLAEVARQRTEDLFLESVADGAALDAEVHTQAAARARATAAAADRALRGRKRKTATRKKSVGGKRKTKK